MFAKNKIKTPLFITVFFVLIVFAIPLTSYADPTVKCPCFTAGEIKRDISKVPLGAESFIQCSKYEGSHYLYYYSATTGTPITAAEIRIPTKTGFVIYSMHGSVPYRNTAVYPSCGTMEQVFEVDEQGYMIENSATDRISIKNLEPPSGGALSAEQQACIDAITEAFPDCGSEVGTDTWCSIMMDPWFAQHFPAPECQ